MRCIKVNIFIGLTGWAFQAVSNDVGRNWWQCKNVGQWRGAWGLYPTLTICERETTRKKSDCTSWTGIHLRLANWLVSVKYDQTFVPSSGILRWHFWLTAGIYTTRKQHVIIIDWHIWRFFKNIKQSLYFPCSLITFVDGITVTNFITLVG